MESEYGFFKNSYYKKMRLLNIISENMKGCFRNSNKKSKSTLNDIFTIPTKGEDLFFSDRAIAQESILDGNPQSAYEHILSLTFDSFKENKLADEDFVGLRFLNIENCCDLILDQIKKSQIALGKLDFNDALDPLFSVYIRRKRMLCHTADEKRWFKHIKNTLNSFRIACLCGYTYNNKCSISNQLMWAHYAKNHTGIAIRYRIRTHNLFCDEHKQSFCFLKPIEYSNKAIPLDALTLDNAFSRKTIQWKYENESRLIYFSSSRKIDNYHILDNFLIEAVYLGINMSPQQEEYIIGKLKHCKIPIFKMRFNDYNLSEIEPYKIL